MKIKKLYRKNKKFLFDIFTVVFTLRLREFYWSSRFCPLVMALLKEVQTTLIKKTVIAMDPDDRTYTSKSLSTMGRHAIPAIYKTDRRALSEELCDNLNGNYMIRWWRHFQKAKTFKKNASFVTMMVVSRRYKTNKKCYQRWWCNFRQSHEFYSIQILIYQTNRYLSIWTNR